MFKGLKDEIRSQFAPDLTFEFRDAVALFWLYVCASMFVTTGVWWWLVIFLLLGNGASRQLFRKESVL